MYTSPKKPSPLSYGSPRSSPFKRPESPHSISPSAGTWRAPTPQQPTPSQLRPASPATAASSVNSASSTPQTQKRSGTPSLDPQDGTITSNSSTPRRNGALNGDPLSKLPPSQIREMRECFQVLDRDNDGQVTRQDVVDVLNELGLDSSNPSLSPYFPPSGPTELNLATYLSTLAALCAPLSRPDELNAAFAAFDVDDSGQIDLEELRDALLNTPPEKGEQALTAREIDNVVAGFHARRTLGKNYGSATSAKPRGEVFRYLDFMATLNGKEDGHQQQQQSKNDVAA